MTFEEAITQEAEKFFEDHPQFKMSAAQNSMVELLKDRISKYHTMDSYTVEEIGGSGGCYLVVFELIDHDADAYLISADGRIATKAMIEEMAGGA